MDNEKEASCCRMKEANYSRRLILRQKYSTRTEVEELIAQYIHFYNFGRIHLKNGLTPYKIWSKAV